MSFRSCSSLFLASSRKVGAAALLTACALALGCHTYTPTTLPNGDPAYTIRCRDKMACVRSADKLCPHGYAVVGSQSEPGRTMVVQCNDTR